MKLPFQTVITRLAVTGQSSSSSFSSSSSNLTSAESRTRTRTRTRRNSSQESAFTMVEIAISLAIIAFALVAIIGVLPLGLDVQKENRQETIINQDAGYFMDAIRNGARGLEDLTNYVLEIRRYVQEYDASTNPVGGQVSNSYTFGFSARNGAP